MKSFKDGIAEGVPIALGYLSVSFAFGIQAVSGGLTSVEALLISMTTLTSAGQFAGLRIMCAYGGYLEMMIAQIIINMRYSLMSISLSQKVDASFDGKYRWLTGTFITDEIYAVALNNKEKINRSYFIGLSTLPYFGWALGTYLGAVFGQILPESASSALGIALYGMFIAIIVPKMRESSKVSIVVIIAIILSSIFYYVPGLSKIPAGFSITICSVLAATFGAVFFHDSAEGGSKE